VQGQCRLLYNIRKLTHWSVNFPLVCYVTASVLFLINAFACGNYSRTHAIYIRAFTWHQIDSTHRSTYSCWVSLLTIFLEGGNVNTSPGPSPFLKISSFSGNLQQINFCSHFSRVQTSWNTGGRSNDKSLWQVKAFLTAQ